VLFETGPTRKQAVRIYQKGEESSEQPSARDSTCGSIEEYPNSNALVSSIDHEDVALLLWKDCQKYGSFPYKYDDKQWSQIEPLMR